MNISAPYNFVPLADQVVQPEWADQVSHDLPFKDGLSGTIHYTLTARSPLLVGGEQTPASQDSPGKVRFYQLPNGEYAIPGSSLKGMVRSVCEIATFSRMNHVDDRRYGLRDITNRKISAAYTELLNNRRYGFIQLDADGQIKLTPCEMTRLHHSTIEETFGLREVCFKAGMSVSEKYKKWREWSEKKNLDPFNIPFDHNSVRATTLGSGSMKGYPVFTGQVSARNKPGEPEPKKGNKKHKDFIFHSLREHERFTVPERSWSDFLFIHSDPYATKKEKDNKKSDSGLMPWDDYWKERFYQGERVPVFYLDDGKLLRLGLAYMPKVAGDFSVHELIAHSEPAHTENTGKDMASLLFGHVDDEESGALRGRVTFLPARHGNSERPYTTEPTILNGPKASFFPNYISQKTDTNSNRISGQSYATYLSTREHPTPTIRGWKRYPARPEGMVGVQELTEEQKDSKKVQVQLEPLPTGATFTGQINFHNLKAEELGALLWAVTWGDDDTYMHSLGMGKSFGFGQCQFSVESLELQHNQPNNILGEKETSPKHYIDTFSRYMDKAVKQGWHNSRQIRALLGMANPGNAQNYPGGLQHMVLSTKGTNEFVEAKKAGSVLPAPKYSASVSLSRQSSNDRWEEATLTWEPGPRQLTAKHANGTAIAGPGNDVVDNMTAEIKKKFKKKKNRITATVEVESAGNRNIILKLEL